MEFLVMVLKKYYVVFNHQDNERERCSMGCADASELARAVWAVVRPHIDPRSRQEVACEFIATFTNQGLSGLEECTQLQEDRETNPDDVFDDWAPENDPYFYPDYLEPEDDQ